MWSSSSKDIEREGALCTAGEKKTQKVGGAEETGDGGQR